MEQLTIYRIKGKTIGLEFLFKYNLKGDLKLFEIVDGVLDDSQMRWLYSNRFPATEQLMIQNWKNSKEFKEKFEIQVAPAVITFDYVWNLLNNKIKKFECTQKWEKSSEAVQIKVAISLPGYNAYCARKGISKTNLATYINKRYYDDDWDKA